MASGFWEALVIFEVYALYPHNEPLSRRLWQLSVHFILSGCPQYRLDAPRFGIFNTCRRVESNPTSAMLTQSTRSAFIRLGAGLYPTHQAVQLPAQCRMQSLVLLHCPAFAYRMLVHGQAAIHPGCVAPVPSRVRPPLQQPQESGFTPVSSPPQSPSTDCPARIARIATPNARICPRLAKRYDLLAAR